MGDFEMNNQTNPAPPLLPQQGGEKAEIEVIADSLESVSWSLNTNALDSTIEKLRAMAAVLPQATVEPITDEQIDRVICQHGTGGWQMMSDMRRFARSILAIATPPASNATELDSVTISKMNTLRENGMRQVGVVMIDDSGKRATIDMGKVLWSTSKADTGEIPLRPSDDKLWDDTLRDRDAYHQWADKLADAIAAHFNVDIGEHSNLNLPWSEALEAIENAEPDHGIEQAAQFIEKKRDDYVEEHGTYDRDTGAMEYPGDGLDYVTQLDELVEEIRGLKSATPSTIKEELRHNQKIFTVDILGQPMREYAPGKWENCIWPSDSIKADAHPQNDLIQAVDRYLSAAYQAGMDGDEFDMLTPKRVIAALAAIKAEPTDRATKVAFEAKHLLRQIINDLPSKRDWLNPDIEKAARVVLAEPTGEQL
jgi:hypothetical protein